MTRSDGDHGWAALKRDLRKQQYALRALGFMPVVGGEAVMDKSKTLLEIRNRSRNVRLELRSGPDVFALMVDGADVDCTPAWPEYRITPPESIPFTKHLDALRAWLEPE